MESPGSFEITSTVPLKVNFVICSQVVRKTEKTRGSAEKQVIFNEALKKTVEEKDRVISELEAQLNQISGRGQSNSADLESQLAQVSRYTIHQSNSADLESQLAQVSRYTIHQSNSAQT